MIKIEENKKEAISFIKKGFPSYSESSEFEKLLICTIKKLIVGAVSYSIIYDRVEINYIFVSPEYRNKKIASKLLKKIIEEANKNNCLNITLEVEITNTPAINLYKKFDFKIVAIRKKYYQNNDGILMEKELR